MKAEEIIRSLLPYGKDFCFVDYFEYINEEGACGYYQYKPESYFYESHFPGNPITPGVIMIETMAQIGLLGLGMFLTASHINQKVASFAFTDSNVTFHKSVLPGESVKVISKKIYFRLRKLKCEVAMYNEQEELVCRGTMSGVVFKPIG